MITSELRAFTKEGMEVFRSWIERAEKSEKRWTSEAPPTSILLEDRYSRPFPGFDCVLVQRKFERKFDLGMEICRALGRENAEKLIGVPNAWAWLSLFYYESTFRHENDRWFVGDRSRHLVQTIQGRKQDQSHRHLVKSAVTNVLRFGEFAAVLMGAASGQSKMEEQVMSRRVDPPLAHHKEFVRTLHRLYWDPEADDLKSGARSDTAGSVMHLIDLLTQFDLTYDISSLEMDDFIGLLPRDFDKFLRDEDEPSPDRPSPPPRRRGGLQRLRDLLTS